MAFHTSSLDPKFLSVLAMEEEMLKFSFYKARGVSRRPFYFKKQQSIPQKRVISKNPSIQLPRPVKSDIRRKYVEMYCNSLNSGDPSLFHSFFRTFAENSLVLKKRFVIETEELVNSTDPIRFDGVETILTYFRSNLMLSPDASLRIGKSELREATPTSGSVILYQFFASGTKLYDATAFIVMEKVCQIQAMYSLSALEVFDHPVFLNFWATIPILENPIPFSMHGLIEMDLNERNLIEVMKYRVFYSLGFSASPF